jgi:predicted DNA-binding transcriptional regulator YafY
VKLSKMSRPATRVLAMLEVLQARGLVGGPELAARLEVDARTVRRYAERLQELGIPVESVRGRHGGYRLRPGYKLPPLMLDDDEATVVVLGLLAARQAGLATAAPAVDGALEKIDRVLPTALRDRVVALQDALGFTRAARGDAAPATSTVLALAGAVGSGERLHIRYASFDGRESERDIDPYGLVVHGERWYLAALDQRSQEVRTFRVDRVLATAATRERATPPPPGFDAVAHVQRSLARTPWNWEVEVELAATAAEVRARVPATVAELEPAPGGVLMRMRAERLDGAAQMLAGLPWRVTVRRPPGLRDELRALARRLVEDAGRAA